MDPFFCRFQRSSPERSGGVDAALGACLTFDNRAEVALLFHPMQKRIERASAQLVAVARKLFKHREPKDGWFMNRVMEDMEPDEAGVKILVFCSCRRGHSKPDIEFRLQFVIIPPPMWYYDRKKFAHQTR